MDENTETLDVEVNIPDSKPFEEEEELEEKETQSESSPDNQPDEETETTEEVVEEPIVDNTEPEKKEPKPVEGETPRERALRKELESERQKVRNLKSQNLFVPEEPISKTTVSEDLSEFDPEELAKFNKLVNITLKKEGYVKKEELQTQTYNEVRDDEFHSFLDVHPEYEKDDLLWKQFQEELSLYAKPQNPKAYKVLFDRVHKSVVGESAVSPNVTAAASEKLKVASHGSATVNKPKPQAKTSSIDPDLHKYMKGWTDEELAEM